jgi:hypothetical protein
MFTSHPLPLFRKVEQNFGFYFVITFLKGRCGEKPSGIILEKLSIKGKQNE